MFGLGSRSVGSIRSCLFSWKWHGLVPFGSARFGWLAISMHGRGLKGFHSARLVFVFV